MRAMVALNRANLAIPEHMKIVRIIMSVVVLRPKEKAARAGATPNDIYITPLIKVSRGREGGE